MTELSGAGMLDISGEILPSYESVTSDLAPFYATGDAGICPRPIADERLHMSNLPTHGNISTLLIRRPWGSSGAPISVLHVAPTLSSCPSSGRNTPCEVTNSYNTLGTPEEQPSDFTGIIHGSDVGIQIEQPQQPPQLQNRPTLSSSSTSPGPSRSSSASSVSSSAASYSCAATGIGSSDCIVSTPDDPCIATILYPKTRLASTVRITIGGVIPFEMKMKRVDFGTRAHEFTSPDGRTYVWRYDMLVGSSMSLYCTSGGLSVKGIKVATMERAVSMIESLVRSDRKLRVDTDWINEEVALITALVMLRKERDRKNGNTSGS